MPVGRSRRIRGPVTDDAVVRKLSQEDSVSCAFATRTTATPGLAPYPSAQLRYEFA